MQAILDIGTGSGCIPIALKLAMPQCKFNVVLDISKEAIGNSTTKCDAI